MASASILPLPRAVFFDANGDLLSGGFVYTYVPGGTTPSITWQDAGETTPNSNPIVLDASGSALIYGSGNYQFTVTDSLGNNIPAYSGLTASPGSGTVTTTDPFNVKNYGAKGDGSTNDTVAIQSAFTAATAAGNGAVYFPAGNYVCSGLFNPGLYLFGDGRKNSILVNPSTTDDTIECTQDWCAFFQLGFTTTATKTSGSFIDVATNVNNTNVRDVYMDGYYAGVTVNGVGTGTKLFNVAMEQGALGGIGVIINGGVDIQLKDLWITGVSPSQQLSAGVVINACGDCSLDHVSTVYAGDGLSLSPAAGVIIQVVTVANCYFDSGNGGGIVVEAAGLVQLLKVSNTWVASNTQHGVILNTTGSGAIQQVDFINSLSSNNTLNGFLVNTAACTGINIDSSSFSANLENGIYIAAASQFFRIVNCSCGDSGEFNGNTGYGIVIASASANYFTMIGNMLINNIAGTINNVATPTAQQYIIGNI